MSRAPVCATDEVWLRHQLGELSVNDSDALTAHLPECPACRARAGSLAALLDDLSAAARDVPADGGAFRRRVRGALTDDLAAAATARGEPPVPRGARWRLLALAAGVALVPAALVLQAHRGRDGEAPGVLTARGSAAPAAPVAEVLLVRDGEPRPLAGQTLGPKDALAVRVGNRSGRPVYLMAFGVDAAGEVHWLFPAYRDPDSDPRALRIEAGSGPRLLDELVAPLRPAAGPLRLHTLLLPAPLTVRAVERRLAARAGSPMSRLFPDATTAEWTTRWMEPTP
jgi:hypothetical protein